MLSHIDSALLQVSAHAERCREKYLYYACKTFTCHFVANLSGKAQGGHRRIHGQPRPEQTQAYEKDYG